MNLELIQKQKQKQTFLSMFTTIHEDSHPFIKTQQREKHYNVDNY